MKPRTKAITFVGEVAHRHEAIPLLTEAGAAALVFRGVARSLAMKCPDGCGEELTINLDARSGPAWRYYKDLNGVSLFPSVWRDTGCQSHFIVWRSKIYWCDWHEGLDGATEEVKAAVLNSLTSSFRHFTEIAEAIDQVPWAVLSACQDLCRRQLAEEAQGKLRGQFRSTRRL